MDKEKVKEALDKYYNGETSLQEDASIKEFLANDKSELYQSEKAQFNYFQSIANQTPRRSVYSKIEDRINVRGIRLVKSFRLAALFILSFGVFCFLFFRTKTSSTVTTKEFKILDMKLPDGTKVSLGQFSTLRYPKVFNSNYREIYLEGEAYFEVTENLNQPFIVHALKTTTKVLGTSFDIRTYAHETVDELTVFTGKVKFGLDNFSTEEEVLPGTQAIFNRNSQRISKETIGLSNVLAWKDNSLVFEDASLQIVIADVGRFFNIKIRVEDTQLLKCRFRGSFRNPDLKNILDVIAYSLNLKYKLVNGSYVFEGKPCSTDK